MLNKTKRAEYLKYVGCSDVKSFQKIISGNSGFLFLSSAVKSIYKTAHCGHEPLPESGPESTAVL